MSCRGECGVVLDAKMREIRSLLSGNGGVDWETQTVGWSPGRDISPQRLLEPGNISVKSLRGRRNNKRRHTRACSVSRVVGGWWLEVEDSPGRRARTSNKDQPGGAIREHV